MDLKAVLDSFNDLEIQESVNNGTIEDVAHTILSSKSKNCKGNPSPNVQFTIKEDDKISVHKANRECLSKSSPVFNAMFTGQLQEAIVSVDDFLNIDIMDIKSNVFSTLLSCIYDPCKILSLPNVSLNDAEFLIDLLYAVKKYMCNDIRLILAYKINKEMTIENAYLYYCQRHLYLEIGKHNCWMVLTSLAHEYINGKIFQEMAAQDVIKFLKNVNTNASELELLKAIIKWAQYKIEDKSSGDELQQIKDILGTEMINAIRYPKKHVQEFFDLLTKYDLPYKKARKEAIKNPQNWMQSFIQDFNSENLYIFASREKLPKEIRIKKFCFCFDACGKFSIKGFLFHTTYVYPKIHVSIFSNQEKLHAEANAFLEKSQDKPCAMYRFAFPLHINSEKCREYAIIVKTPVIMTHKVVRLGFYDADWGSIFPKFYKGNNVIWGLLTA